MRIFVLAVFFGLGFLYGRGWELGQSIDAYTTADRAYDHLEQCREDSWRVLRASERALGYSLLFMYPPRGTGWR